MSISDWPEEQRPRERLISHGAHVLSDAELLAIFLRTGIPGKSAVDLGRELMQQFGSLRELFTATLPAFSAVRGLGPAKYAQLQAVLELARRSLTEQLQSGILLSAPQPVRQYLQLSLGRKNHECFVVLFLDARNRLIKTEELSRGTLTHASVYPREVVKSALSSNAAAVILAHNHPSGIAEPSTSDLMLTETLKSALELMEISVLDHLIVAGANSYSFAEHGQL
jgi:DNA repair protein RadC